MRDEFFTEEFILLIPINRFLVCWFFYGSVILSTMLMDLQSESFCNAVKVLFTKGFVRFV